MDDTNRKQLESLLGLKSPKKVVLTAVIAGIIAFIIAPFMFIILGAATGAVSGWVFPATLDLISTALVGKTLPYWQLGAGLGFVAGIFRTVTVKK
jgi:hypothetical protein